MWLYSLPVVALFVITMAANLISQITKNSFVKKYASAADKYLFIAFGGIVSVAVLFLFGGIKNAIAVHAFNGVRIRRAHSYSVVFYASRV